MEAERDSDGTVYFGWFARNAGSLFISTQNSYLMCFKSVSDNDVEILLKMRLLNINHQELQKKIRECDILDKI